MADANQQPVQPQEMTPNPTPEMQQQMPGMPEMQKQIVNEKTIIDESTKAKEEANNKIVGTQHKIDLLAAIKVDQVVIPKM